MAKRYYSSSPVTREGGKAGTPAKKAPKPAKPFQRPPAAEQPAGKGKVVTPPAKGTPAAKPTGGKAQAVTPPIDRVPSSVPRPPAKPVGGKAKAGAPAAKAGPVVSMSGPPPEVLAAIEAAKQRAAEVKAAPKVYVVKSGDSLSKIAKEMLGDAARWPEIFELNKDKISDPNLIYVGQELRLP